MTRHYILVDVETRADDGIEALVEKPEAPGNYKDPAKIAAYIGEATRKAIDKAALDIYLAKPVYLGVRHLFPDGEVRPESTLVLTDEDERAALRRLWAWWDASPSPAMVGFNCLAYDAPLLMARSLLLGVPHPGFKLSRYNHPEIVDLADVLTFGGAVKMHALSFYCQRFGVPHDDTFSGADVADAYRRGDYAAIAAHCEDDLSSTQTLAEWLGVLA